MFNLFRDELAAQIQEESKRLEETRYCPGVEIFFFFLGTWVEG